MLHDAVVTGCPGQDTLGARVARQEGAGRQALGLWEPEEPARRR